MAAAAASDWIGLSRHIKFYCLFTPWVSRKNSGSFGILFNKQIHWFCFHLLLSGRCVRKHPNATEVMAQIFKFERVIGICVFQPAYKKRNDDRAVALCLHSLFPLLREEREDDMAVDQWTCVKHEKRKHLEMEKEPLTHGFCREREREKKFEERKQEKEKDVSVGFHGNAHKDDHWPNLKTKNTRVPYGADVPRLTDANRHTQVVLETMALNERERRDRPFDDKQDQLTFSLISKRWHVGCLFRTTNWKTTDYWKIFPTPNELTSCITIGGRFGIPIETIATDGLSRVDT